MEERSIFLAALARPFCERADLVAKECEGDPRLRQRIESLLKAHASDNDILDSPAAVRLSVLLPGAIPDYSIVTEIHRGGQGIVYLATQDATGREVALKVMLDGPFNSANALQQFELEIEIARRLQHPNIAKILDHGVADGLYYFVMEYIRGRLLTRYVNDQNDSLQDKLVLAQKICQVLGYAHQHGVIHRDLKPSNILVDDWGEPYLLDFGLARTSDPAAWEQRSLAGSQSSQIVGTPIYMSPEQAAGELNPVDCRSDVYSLGVILFQLLSGKLPYDVNGRIADILSNVQVSEPLRLRKLNHEISDDVEMIVQKALSKEKERRYATAGSLGEDIGRSLSGQPIEAKRESTVLRFSES